MPNYRSAADTLRVPLTADVGQIEALQMPIAGGCFDYGYAN